jgi:UDP-glucose 4-epimerase
MKSTKIFRKKVTNQNIIISGGAGFIGSYLIEECIRLKAKTIIVLDNLSVGKLENIQHIKNKVIFKKIDCEDLNKIKNIIKKYEIDVVFNLATIALPFSFKYPRKTLETNTIITLNFLELLRNKKYKTLCHFSSSEIYGSAKIVPMNEEHPKNPTTTYAAGKLAADLAIQTYVKMFGIDAFILRPFNNYGPRQLITRDEIGVIPKTVKRILKNLKPIIYGSGKQIRDFIFV